MGWEQVMAFRELRLTRYELGALWEKLKIIKTKVNQLIIEENKSKN